MKINIYFFPTSDYVTAFLNPKVTKFEMFNITYPIYLLISHIFIKKNFNTNVKYTFKQMLLYEITS